MPCCECGTSIAAQPESYLLEVTCKNDNLEIVTYTLLRSASEPGQWEAEVGSSVGDHRTIGLDAAIQAGLDKGINWIDTAAVYGLGHSEEVVARAVKGRNPKPYVFTKCERIWGDDRQIRKSLKRDSIFQECENSLRRLQTDVIDLYQVHWPEPDED